MKARLFLSLALVAMLVLVVACASPEPTKAPAASSSAASSAASSSSKAASSSAASSAASSGAFTPPTDALGVVKIGPSDPIHIAYMLVTSGSDGSLGIDSRRGIEIAVDDRGGKLLDHAIKLDGQDSGCGAEGGQAAAAKLAADATILGVIGSSCSSEIRAGGPALSKAGFTVISPSNTAPDLTDPAKRFAGYFRTAHNDKVQGAVAAQFALSQLKITKAATIHDGSPYAQGLADAFAENFKKGGGTITNAEAIGPDDKDFKPVLTKIAANKPELVFYPIFVAAGSLITSQSKSIPGLETVNLMSADGTFSPDFYKASGKAVVGMYQSSPDFSAFGSGYADFLAKHQKKFNEKPISAFHAHAYDAANILLNAIEKVAVKGPDGSLYVGRQALRDAVGKTSGWKGVTGTITCDPNGDCADPKIAIYKISQDNLDKLQTPEKPFWVPGVTTGASSAPASSAAASSSAPASSAAFAVPTDALGVVKLGPSDPIHIAYMLVTSGADGSLGIDSRRGIEIAVDDRGGKLLDHAIKFDGQDSGCGAEGGQAAAAKLAADATILGVIGSSCSSEIRAGGPALSKAGFTVISPSNTAPDLTDPAKRFAGYFRTAHNDKVQGAVAAQFALTQLKVKTAATIHDGSPYAQGLATAFAENFTKGGGKITNAEAIGPDDKDFKPVLTKIAANKPELVFYPIFVAAGSLITSQSKSIPGLETVNLMSADGTFSPDFYKASGKAVVGMYQSSPDFSAFGSGYADFLAKHQKKYNEKPISAFHAHAYDAANVLLDAIAKVAVKGPDGSLYIGRQALRDAVGKTSGLKGVTGTITCDPNGDCADPKIAIYKISQDNLDKLQTPDKPFWKP